GSEMVESRPDDTAVWYGAYVKWLGDFRAIRPDTGEVFASNTLIVPEIANAKIRAAMGIAENNAGARQNVMLGFRLGVTSEARKVGNKGYAYVLRDIQPAHAVAPAIDGFIDDAYTPAERQLAYTGQAGLNADAVAEAAE